MLHLKEYRKKKNLKQADVANELGISRQAYSHYEVGKRQPDYEILLKLAELYETSVEALITGEEKFGVGFEYKMTDSINKKNNPPKIVREDVDELYNELMKLDDIEIEQARTFLRYIRDQRKN